MDVLHTVTVDPTVAWNRRVLRLLSCRATRDTTLVGGREPTVEMHTPLGSISGRSDHEPDD